MSAIDEILQEYILMRENGLEIQEALHALKVHIQSLALGTREQLAQYLRSWETGNLKVENPLVPKHKLSQLNQQAPPTSEFIWVECRNCSKNNLAKEVFCFNCGEMLQSVAGLFDTRQFRQAQDGLFDSQYFSQDSVLTLKAKNAAINLEIRPQLHNRELILGRGFIGDTGLDIVVDSEKTTVLGVSRTHLGIRFDKQTATLQLHDLGSSNGTFINEERLHPSERRALCHKDELRLGYLIFTVRFIHLGEEL